MNGLVMGGLFQAVSWELSSFIHFSVSLWCMWNFTWQEPAQRLLTDVRPQLNGAPWWALLGLSFVLLSPPPTPPILLLNSSWVAACRSTFLVLTAYLPSLPNLTGWWHYIPIFCPPVEHPGPGQATVLKSAMTVAIVFCLWDWTSG